MPSHDPITTDTDSSRHPIIQLLSIAPFISLLEYLHLFIHPCLPLHSSASLVPSEGTGLAPYSPAPSPAVKVECIGTAIDVCVSTDIRQPSFRPHIHL